MAAIMWVSAQWQYVIFLLPTCKTQPDTCIRRVNVILSRVLLTPRTPKSYTSLYIIWDSLFELHLHWNYICSVTVKLSCSMTQFTISEKMFYCANVNKAKRLKHSINCPVSKFNKLELWKVWIQWVNGWFEFYNFFSNYIESKYELNQWRTASWNQILQLSKL